MQWIKRFDDSGHQCSNLYQLLLPESCHIEQRDLTHDTSELITVSSITTVAKIKMLTSALAGAYVAYTHAANTIHQLNAEQSNTPQKVNRSNMESDSLVHIISHKEHKPGLSLKNTTVKREHLAHTEEEKGDVVTTDTLSLTIKNADTKSPDEAVIHLLIQEVRAPIYREFFTILESTYPNLVELQPLQQNNR
ncbi:hypothetical protein VCHA38O209_80164 [Vibrio chagasii]|nr:hypothetical protein VCHA38O209_80164 [Vibrio chagasii]